MEIRKDASVGIVPVYTGSDGMRSFCLVHHAAGRASPKHDSAKAGLRHAEAGSGLAKAGHWAFPKGHQDAGESREAAARRELYEETGILTCKIDGARTFTEKYSFEKDGVRYDKQVDYFVGFVDSLDHTPPEAFKSEITESRWVAYDEAKELLTFSEAKNLLDEVQAHLALRA